MSSVDITQMHMVLALSESCSMTLTARKMRLTQPALTYRLNNIEKELGFKIFNRSHSGTSLTREGVYFCERLREIVSRYDEGVRLARAMSKASAVNLRIGTNNVSRDSVSLYLRMCRDSFPDLDYSVVGCGKSNIHSLLKEQVVDFWSCSDAALGEPWGDELEYVQLFTARQTVHLSANHPLADKDVITLDDMVGETVWLWPNGSFSRQSDAIRAEIERRGLDIDVEEYMDDMPIMLTVMSSGGLAIYDDGFISPAPRHVVQRPLQWEGSDSIGLAYLARYKERLDPIAQRFREIFEGYDPGIKEGPFSHVERLMAVLDNISSTVARGGMKDVEPLVQSALDLDMSAQEILDKGLLAGIYAIRADFKEGDAYTPEMLAAVDTMNIGTAMLRPYIDAEKDMRQMGHAVIGTMKGDVHDIGKNLVRFMLQSKGMEVTDLGVDVSPEAFVEYVRNDPQCNLVLISAFLDSDLEHVDATIKLLEQEKLRDQVFVMIGGTAASAEFAAEVGADAYTEDAVQAAEKAVELLSW